MPLIFRNRYWVIVEMTWSKETNKSLVRVASYEDKADFNANIANCGKGLTTNLYFDGEFSLAKAESLVSESPLFLGSNIIK